MADVFSKKKRSEIMSRIRSKNTEPEKVLFDIARKLHKEGLRYAKHPSKISGKPDLAILKHKIAIFVDSEFWHGKNFGDWRNRLPKTYWREKISANIDRDKQVEKMLKNQKWKVIRVWAKSLMKDAASLEQKIKRLTLAR